MDDVIARLELVGESPPGGRFTILAELGRPEPLGGTNNDWRCHVSVTPLMHRVLPVRGIHALDALGQAIGVVSSLLAGFVKDDGRLLYPESGEEFDVESISTHL